MTDIEIRVYSDHYLDQWDSLVNTSRNGTFLNTKRFLNYHPPERFDDTSLLFFKKKLLVAVIPAAIQKKGNKKIFFSHPGSTYGGIIIGKKVNLHISLEIVRLLVEHCKQTNFDEIIIKPPPKIYHIYPSDEVDFSLYKKGFFIKKRDLTTTIKLKDLNSEQGRSIESRCIRAIRKAEKEGIIVYESDDLELYWEILKENLKEKYDTMPVHTIKEIRLLKKLFPENLKLFVATLDNEIIGGTLTFITKTTIHTQYIAMLYKYQNLRPTNAVFSYLIDYGLDHGFSFLNFGVSTEQFGESINRGLFDFKESFGGGGILHEQFYLDLKGVDRQ